MALAWYKREPEKALAGMKRLKLDERGAYNTVLDLLYMHDGELDDDDQFIAGWCSCDVRIWKRIKVRLLALEKLYLVDGKLRNDKADRVVADALAKGAANSYAGQQSGRVRAAKSRGVSNGNNGLAQANVPTNGEHALQPFLEDRISNLTVSTSAAAAARSSASPGGPPPTRLTTEAEWQKRVEGYNPSEIRKTWKPAWGPTPDSPATSKLIPADLVQWWKAQRAQQRTGADA